MRAEVLYSSVTQASSKHDMNYGRHLAIQHASCWRRYQHIPVGDLVRAACHDAAPLNTTLHSLPATNLCQEVYNMQACVLSGLKGVSRHIQACEEREAPTSCQHLHPTQLVACNIKLPQANQALQDQSRNSGHGCNRTTAP